MAKVVNRLTTYLILLCCFVVAIPSQTARAIIDQTDSVESAATVEVTDSDQLAGVTVLNDDTSEPAGDAESVASEPRAAVVDELEVVDSPVVQMPVSSELPAINVHDQETEEDEDQDQDLASPLELLISKVQIGTTASAKEEFIEIYNPSDVAVVVRGVTVEYLTANHDGGANPTRTIKLLEEVTILAQGYYVLASPSYPSTDADAIFDDKGHHLAGHLASNGSVRLMQDGVELDLVGWGSAKQYRGESIVAEAVDESLPLERCVDEAGWLVNTDHNQQDFAIYMHDLGVLWRQSAACPSQQPQPEPTNACIGLVLSEIGANLDEQYIEILNPTDADIELAGCRLAIDRNSSQHVFEAEPLKAGQYKLVYVKDIDLSIIKTTHAVIYLLSEDEQSEIDSTSYTSPRPNTSWSLIDGEWKETYALTPGEANVYQQYLPCQPGYERNTETGRCNKITLATEPAPCASNQFRNPATGRCKLVDSGNQLTPCRAGQYRHPETNRCRNIASAANQLTPCRPGQERNPATNRCRKIRSAAHIEAAGFPVEPVVDGAQAFVGWWALGGVLLLGLGYAGWEWRHEITNIIRRAKPTG